MSTLTLHHVRAVRAGAGVAADCASEFTALGCKRVLIVTGAPIRALCTGLETALEKAGLISHPPITVSLATDKYRLVDGMWPCTYRRFEHLFEGDTPVTNPNLDDDD